MSIFIFNYCGNLSQGVANHEQVGAPEVSSRLMKTVLHRHTISRTYASFKPPLANQYIPVKVWDRIRIAPKRALPGLGTTLYTGDNKQLFVACPLPIFPKGHPRYQVIYSAFNGDFSNINPAHFVAI